MPCLAVLLAFMAPRLLIIILWLFTAWFQGVYTSVLWPILGFIFLPTTLLWFTAVHHWFGGVWSFWPIVGVIVALLIDLSPASAKRDRA
jgi:hypothetical protein